MLRFRKGLNAVGMARLFLLPCRCHRGSREVLIDSFKIVEGGSCVPESPAHSNVRSFGRAR